MRGLWRKNLFILTLWGGFFKAHLRAESPHSQQATNLLGDGRRISLRGGEVTILTAKNWEVYTDIPGLTLLMRAPFASNLPYQRTIQVASFNGPRYMDEVTASEFESLIVRKFSATTSAIRNYRIRNHTTVDLEDGRLGFLFYSEFSIDDVNLMQAHILVSTVKKHYLVTYTDVAGHFEGASAGPYLDEAWKAMRSARFVGESPKRFSIPLMMSYAVGGLLVLGGMIWFFRGLRSSRSLNNDVLLAYDEKTAHLAKDEDATPWTLPDPKTLSSSAEGVSHDDELAIEDDAS